MISFIKKIIPYNLKSILKALLSKNNHLYREYTDRKKIFIFLAADYGNLGDVAISRAQFEFLKYIFDDYDVISIPISKTFVNFKSYKEIVKKNDIITIIGGGNTSPRYSDIEFCRQFIISSFKNNKIITFPQSVDYDHFNKKFSNKFKKVYEKNKNILYFVREEFSYNFLKKNFPNLNLYLFPDIVFSLNLKSNFERNDIVLSLRNDKEKALSKYDEIKMIKIIKEHSNCRITRFDTQKIDTNSQEVDRNIQLNKLIDIYQHSKLVVTDRLHGMILAYITNTPCIVLSCDNNKIKGSYNWIKSCSKVHFMDNFDEGSFLKNLNRMLNSNPPDNKPLVFNKMEKIIKEFVYEITN